MLFEWQTCSKVGNYQRAATTTRLECIHPLYCSRGLNFRATASNHFNPMAATINHPAFVQPSDFSAKIWRYMDFAKFVSFLDSSNLYLARLDQMPDPFEGSLSRAEYEHWKDVAEEGERTGAIPDDWKGRYLDVLLANARRTRRACYVSCWHMSDNESDAMWKLYAPSGLGVAIQSTYQRLVEVLPDKLHSGCFVGMVAYADHHREKMPEGNAFYPVMHKRRAFEHEKEVRAVGWIADPGFWVDPDQAANPLGIEVPVAVDRLIESVFVSPAAPSWFAATVRSVVRKYGFKTPVMQSELGLSAYF